MMDHHVKILSISTVALGTGVYDTCRLAITLSVSLIRERSVGKLEASYLDTSKIPANLSVKIKPVLGLIEGVVDTRVAVCIGITALCIVI